MVVVDRIGDFHFPFIMKLFFSIFTKSFLFHFFKIMAYDAIFLVEALYVIHTPVYSGKS